jgi:flagellar biosynthesis GTPase FlhF
MPTVTVLAPDSALAMDEVIRQLGDNAYILATNARDGQVEILATNEPAHIQTQRKRVTSVSFADLISVHVSQGGDANAAVKTKRGGDDTLAVAAQGPEQGVASNVVVMPQTRTSWNEAAPTAASNAAMSPQQPATQTVEAPAQAVTGLHPMLKNISERLYALEATTAAHAFAQEQAQASATTTDHFAAVGFSAAIVARMAPKPDDPDPAAKFAETMAKALVAPAPLAGLRARAIVIAGASGVGKTALAAKIAARILETQAGRRIELVSVSDVPPATGIPLTIYARMLSVGHRDFRFDQFDVGQFAAHGTTYVFDTNLKPEALNKMLGALRTHFENTKISLIVALNAGSSTARIVAELLKYNDLDAKIALTKLDECEFSSQEASQIAEIGSQIAWLSSGSQALTDSLSPATEEIICEFLIGLLAAGH